MFTPGSTSSFEAVGTPFQGIERRQHVRRQVLIPATLDTGHEHKPVILDISRSGLGLMLLSGQEMSRLCLRFKLPDSGVEVRATGELRWRKSSGRLGIHLIAIDCKPREWHGWFDGLKASKPPIDPWTQAPPRYLLLKAASTLEKEFTAGHITAEAALQTVVTTTVDVMNYAGAAIVLKQGAKFVCQASAGVAPAAGTALEQDATLSEQCIRTGRVLICQTRANSPVNDSNALEAAVLVPLGRSGPVMGMFAVFGSSPDAIGDQDVSVFSDTGIAIDQIFAHAAGTAAAPELRSEEPQVTVPPQSELSTPSRAKSWQHLFRWGAVAVLASAALGGILAGTKPVLRALLSAQDSAASAPASPDSGLPIASTFSSPARTQIIIVEGSPVLNRPVSTEPGASRKLTQGRLAHRTDVIFPAAAVQAGIAGDVKAVLTISEKGSVDQVDILQGDSLLADGVASALGHWRYLPFKLQGKPVSVKLPVTVSFLLRNSNTSSRSQRR